MGVWAGVGLRRGRAGSGAGEPGRLTQEIRGTCSLYLTMVSTSSTRHWGTQPKPM